MKVHRIIIATAFAAVAFSCSVDRGSLTKSEISLINDSPQVMRVLVVGNEVDSLLLRTPCADFRPGDIASDVYRTLAQKMVSTVTSPEQDGVGIAGPQVGISRRVIAVQRFDKEGEPFEVYPNIRIVNRGGSLKLGWEGCLSIPGRRGEVMRYTEVEISYVNPVTLRDTTETVTDYTAVIFQHECDHLDGVLYTDHIK